MTDPTDKGLIDAADRVLSQLLQSPAFKNSSRILFNNLDADSSRRLIRTILWQDSDFALSLMAAAPALGNALVYLVDELLDQLEDKFPPDMLAGYLENALREIDRETLDQARQKAGNMVESLYPVMVEALRPTAEPGGAGGDGSVTGDVAGSAPPGDIAGGEESDSAETEPTAGSAGVLAEILRTSFLKDMLREGLNSVDPEKGRAAARALLWEDMETGFAVLGALPALINFYINTVAELGTQLSDKIPPRLFVSFVGEVLSEIDFEAAARGLENWRQLGQTLVREGGLDLDTRLHELLTNPVTTRTLARGLNQGLARVNRLEEKHPGTIWDFLSGVVAAADKNEINRATRHITEAVLDQRPPFFTIAWRTVKLYLWGWFKRSR